MNINKYLVMALLCCMGTACEAYYENEKDLGLAHEAKITMILKKGVPSARIKTHANKGSLQIAGYVSNNKEYAEVLKAIDECLKQDATEIINNVKICDIKNDPANDKALEKLVLKHLKTDNFPLKDISVQAKGKHVMLSGFVSKYIDINRVIALVKKVPGVLEVDNCLLHKQ